jgi:hypothetical protein
VFLTKKEISHVIETVSVTLCQIFVKFRISSVFKKMADVRFLKISAALSYLTLGVSEFLPVISIITCPVWAKCSVDLCMMLLSFVTVEGVKLILYCGHK